MSLGTGRGEIVRAVVDGIAAQVAELVDAVAQDVSHPMTRLRVDGGLTASRVLMQATADLTRVPVDVYPHPHATALGTAALGRLSLDHQLSLSGAIFDWRPTVTYRPRWDAGRAQEFRDRWRDTLQRNMTRSVSGGTEQS
jgi:glycerol kinase